MKKDPKETSTSLTTDLQNLNLAEMSLSELETISKGLAKSKIIPHDDPQDVIAAIMLSGEIGISPLSGVMMGKKLNKNSIFSVLKGKALGIDPITAIEQLHYITDSSSSTGIHIMTALALKANISFDIIEDYKPVYGYISKDKNFIRKEDLDSEIHKIVGDGKPDPTKLSVIPSGKPMDFKTTINFKRTLGNGKDMEITLTYYYSEFINLHEKDNWKNNKKTMLRNRTLAIGFRLIGDDVLNGIYEDSEIADTNNIKYNIQEVPVAETVQDLTDVQEEEVIEFEEVPNNKEV